MLLAWNARQRDQREQFSWQWWHANYVWQASRIISNPQQASAHSCSLYVWWLQVAAGLQSAAAAAPRGLLLNLPDPPSSQPEQVTAVLRDYQVESSVLGAEPAAVAFCLHASRTPPLTTPQFVKGMLVDGASAVHVVHGEVHSSCKTGHDGTT
jgi:hypothetical protein